MQSARNRTAGSVTSKHQAASMTRAVAALALASVAGCATLGALGVTPLRFQEAADREPRLRILGPSADRPYGAASIRLWAEVENPNDFGLTLTEVAGELIVQDSATIAVDFPLGLPLSAGQDTVIPLDVTVGFDDVPNLGDAARSAIAGGALRYRLVGTFSLDAGRLGEPRFGPRTLLSGELRVR